MSDSFYFDDDIAIISTGCVLPQAGSPDEFWTILKDSRSTIGPISKKRWKRRHHISPYRELDDKAYSSWGAEITPEMFEDLRKKHQLTKEENSLLDVMSIDAVSQALTGVKLPEDRSRVGFIMGIMNTDEKLFANYVHHNQTHITDKVLGEIAPDRRAKAREMIDYYNDKERGDFTPHMDFTLSTSTVEKIKRRFGLKGVSMCVDAACASSIASIDLCAKKLKNGEIDLAIAGGIESNLSPGAFVLFSKVGALAVEHTQPFDKSSDGLSQGEGAVVFVLKRLSDAVRDQDKIWGVIRSCAGSSDGRVASLFQPSLSGQILAYTLAHRDFKYNRVDYLELHGTGTKIGDQSEAQSIASFFKDYQIPIGSVKSLVGHTKATAGATGLLKCLLMMRENLIPGSPYVKNSVLPTDSKLFVNTSPITLTPRSTPYRMALSSFGFGGCNYHMTVESYLPKVEVRKRDRTTEQEPLVLVSESHRDIDDFDPKWFTAKDVMYRLPPKSLPQIDRVQLLAVKTTEEAFQNAGINPTRLNGEKVSVISASTIGLDILEHMSMRLTLDTLAEMAKEDYTKGEFPEEDLKVLVEGFLKLKEEYHPVTEDSGPGILNNVIAGRICNAFNFKGKNYNLDCDVASIAAAVDVIATEVQFSPDDIIVLIGVEETVDPKAMKVIRHRVSSYVLTSLSNARAKMLPVEKVIQARRGSHAV